MKLDILKNERTRSLFSRLNIYIAITLSALLKACGLKSPISSTEGNGGSKKGSDGKSPISSTESNGGSKKGSDGKSPISSTEGNGGSKKGSDGKSLSSGTEGNGGSKKGSDGKSPISSTEGNGGSKKGSGDKSLSSGTEGNSDSKKGSVSQTYAGQVQNKEIEKDLIKDLDKEIEDLRKKLIVKRYTEKELDILSSVLKNDKELLKEIYISLETVDSYNNILLKFADQLNIILQNEAGEYFKKVYSKNFFTNEQIKAYLELVDTCFLKVSKTTTDEYEKNVKKVFYSSQNLNFKDPQVTESIKALSSLVRESSYLTNKTASQCYEIIFSKNEIFNFKDPQVTACIEGLTKFLSISFNLPAEEKEEYYLKLLAKAFKDNNLTKLETATQINNINKLIEVNLRTKAKEMINSDPSKQPAKKPVNQNQAKQNSDLSQQPAKELINDEKMQKNSKALLDKMDAFDKDYPNPGHDHYFQRIQQFNKIDKKTKKIIQEQLKLQKELKTEEQLKLEEELKLEEAENKITNSIGSFNTNIKVRLRNISGDQVQTFFKKLLEILPHLGLGIDIYKKYLAAALEAHDEIHPNIILDIDKDLNRERELEKEVDKLKEVLIKKVNSYNGASKSFECKGMLKDLKGTLKFISCSFQDNEEQLLSHYFQKEEQLLKLEEILKKISKLNPVDISSIIDTLANLSNSVTNGNLTKKLFREICKNLCELDNQKIITTASSLKQLIGFVDTGKLDKNLFQKIYEKLIELHDWDFNFIVCSLNYLGCAVKDQKLDKTILEEFLQKILSHLHEVDVIVQIEVIKKLLINNKKDDVKKEMIDFTVVYQDDGLNQKSGHYAIEYKEYNINLSGDEGIVS